MDQCRLGAGRYQKYPHSSNFTCTNLHMKVVFQALCFLKALIYFCCIQVALDKQKRVFTWGFGGYGRLGHKVQKDEWTPKMVEIQGGDRNLCPPDCVVAAGQTTSWVTALMGQMYCFGRLKTTGDNTMYPVPFLDLQGWRLRSVACGATTYAACGEDQAITWGQGAGCGELGYGPEGPKSSANPNYSKCLFVVA